VSAPAKRGRPRKMRYARLMGDFWKHDKTKPLPLAVVGLVAKAWSFASGENTDGKVPTSMIDAWCFEEGGRLFPKDRRKAFGHAEALRGELLASGYFDEAGCDLIARDWTEHNISAEKWEAKVARDSARKVVPFPIGNDTGNDTHFRDVSLDQDHDHDQRDLRRVSDLETAGPPSPAEDHDDEESEGVEIFRPSQPQPAPVPRGKVSASVAYSAAVVKAGGIFAGPDPWRQHFDAVERLAVEMAKRDGGEAQGVLDGWAREYFVERTTRRPDYWREWCTAKAATGQAKPAAAVTPLDPEEAKRQRVARITAHNATIGVTK
jgi:hypothetical protein